MTDLAAGPLFGLPLADLWFALLFCLLGAFVLLDGFDFGVGALFALRHDEAEREHLLAVVGPFWDGNEVWLVVFGGALFAAFPTVYAAVFSRYYLLLFCVLALLILRGLAPEFREQREDDAWRRWWGRSFVAGSVGAPFCLGVFVADWTFGLDAILTVPGVLVGLALVALTIADGVAFVRLKVEGDLRETVRPYGERAAAAYLALVVVTLAYVVAALPRAAANLLTPLGIACVALSVLAGVGYALALRRGRDRAAFGAVALTVVALVALVARFMYPLVDPAAGTTVADAIVSTLPLNLMSIAAVILLPLVSGYFVLLYTSFSGSIESGEGY
ncbi:cytochrome d ubiquinol oxidase subunit II [Halarchaeum acidiphilum MH1-52-1]|uniref:Cytochrome d ubiquinol oxidase subunit II n=2 Tax=Halarchaeum acidiphilum TaxID=489138 RepID=U3A3R5_9EURY|nr:cytochrome d ubiquinol oxidase subunit II [Halarchaeum acidiphilum]GAD52284.1 cytochrome d ubiquinol oxidase subunit II [Halarchaeum acidiphilum MH1-52-1]